MRPDELRDYDHLLRWFLWTWLGEGTYAPRPPGTLEQALRLMRVAHAENYPSRRRMREHELALAWVADSLREEPRRLPAATRLSTGAEVPVTLWADIGAGRRVSFGLGVANRDREVLLEPDAAWALTRQLLTATGELRRPEQGPGVRTDTVVIPVSFNTWTEDQDEPVIIDQQGGPRYRNR